MPLLLKSRKAAPVRFAVWEITEGENELLQMLPYLDPSDQEFLAKISLKPRRLEWLASRILLHQMTSMYPKVHYKNNGQPAIKNCHEHISISHTRKFAAVALSERFIPGIDIERPSPRIQKVKNRFLNEQEKEFITIKNENDQIGLIWCAKEAIFKKTGQKELNFRENIIVSPFFPKRKGKFLAYLFPGCKQETSIELHYLKKKEFYLVWTAH